VPTTSYFPSTNAAHGSDAAFTSPGNCYADDAVNATTGTSLVNYGVILGNYGISLPGGATISAVQIIAKCYVGNVSRPSDLHACARLAGVDQTVHDSLNFAAGSTAPAYVTFDITADRAWAPGDFTNANFQVSFWEHPSGSLGSIFNLDVVRVDITYSTSVTITSTPSGGLVLGGGRSFQRVRTFTAAGGIRLGGTTVTKFPGPINLTAPVVSGSLVQGQVLTCSPGTWQQGS
jgi:hypothetical protein